MKVGLGNTERMKIGKAKVKRISVAVFYIIFLLEVSKRNEVEKAGAFPYGIVVLMLDGTIQPVDTRCVKIASDTEVMTGI